ncbi:MAG: caspase family protein [Fimbriimonadaceae bacterium]
MNRLVKLTIVTFGAVLLLNLAVPQTQNRSSRLRLIPTISDQRMEDIQESPDGTRLLTHDRGFAPRIWEPKTMSLLGIFTHDNSSVDQAEMSRSGKLVITNSHDQVRLWDSKSAKLLVNWGKADWNDDAATRVAISQDDQLVVIAGTSNVYIAKAPKFKLELFASLSELAKNEIFATDVQISADNKFFALASSNAPGIHLYDVETKSLRILKTGTEGNHWSEISPDCKQLLATGSENHAFLIDIATGNTLGTYDHYIGEKGFFPNTLMAALFVGKNLAEFVVCGPTGIMTIYDRTTLKQLRQLKGYSHPIREIRKSTDGLKLATYESIENDDYDALKVWDVTTTKEYTFNRAGLPTAGAFNPDGTIFWVGYVGGSIVRHRLSDGEWDSSTFSAVKVMNRLQFFGDTGFLALSSQDNSTNFYVFDSRKIDLDNYYQTGYELFNKSANGQFALSPAYYKDDDKNEVNAPACWDAVTDKLNTLFFPTTLGTVWLPDNTFIRWSKNTVDLWNPAKIDDPDTKGSEKFVRALLETKNNVRFVIPSKDGTTAIIVTYENENSTTDIVYLVDVATGEYIGGIDPKVFTDNTMFAYHKGKPFLLKTDEKVFAVDPKTVELLWEYVPEYRISQQMEYSEDGSYILFINSDSVTKVNAEDGKIINRVKINSESGFNETESTFSPELNLLSVVVGREVYFFDAKDLTLFSKTNRPDFVTHVEMIPSKNRLVLVDKMEQATIWDINEIRKEPEPTPIGTFVMMINGSWLVMDREGRFDSPDPNNVTGASYVLEWADGLEPISVSQLKSLYYEPGLFGKLTGFNPEPTRAVPDRNTIRLFPDIKLEKSTRNPNRITVTLTDRDEGGIGKTEIYLNNKLIDTKDKTGFININLEDYKTYFLPKAQLPNGQGNILSVVSSNLRGDLKSLPETLDVGIPENLAIPEVNIYGLFVGVGDYAGAKKDLTAPPMDAKKLAEAVGESAERLLPNHVHITTITTDDKEHIPNRQPILDWFAQVATKATSSDIIVVFFAGHGTSQIGDQSGYFFLTAGADPGDVTPAILGVHTISGEDLKVALAKIPASKQVIILDTCHSGAAASDIIKDRASGSDYIRAYESIRDSSGTWLLAGAAADQLSYESRSVDHGLLTYSLLEAIDRVTPDGLRSTPSGELFLDVDRWFNYAATRVESLRNEIGIDGVQKPEVRKGATNQTFDIGVTRETFRGEIGLKAPKPIVLLGTFDQDQEDPLKLEAALSEALKDEPGYKLWLNVAKHPKVFRIAGSYTQDGDKVTLRLFIQQFDADQVRKNLKVIEITGVAQDIPGLVQKIRETIKKELPALSKSIDTPHLAAAG